MNLANNIKDARIRSGLTQAELAKRIGTDQKAISGYERGTRSPKLDKIPKLAKVLQVSIDDLVQI